MLGEYVDEKGLEEYRSRVVEIIQTIKKELYKSIELSPEQEREAEEEIYVNGPRLVDEGVKKGIRSREVLVDYVRAGLDRFMTHILQKTF